MEVPSQPREQAECHRPVHSELTAMASFISGDILPQLKILIFHHNTRILIEGITLCALHQALFLSGFRCNIAM